MAIKKAPLDDDDAPFDADPPRKRVHTPIPPRPTEREIKRAPGQPATGVVRAAEPGLVPPPRATSEPTPAARQEVRRGFLRVVSDSTGHTAIELRRDDTHVSFIPLSPQGFEVVKMPRKEYDATYREIQGYPIPRAASLYIQWAQHLGATADAMAELKKLAPVKQSEYDRATAPRESTSRREEKPIIGKLIK